MEGNNGDMPSIEDVVEHRDKETVRMVATTIQLAINQGFTRDQLIRIVEEKTGGGELSGR